MSNLSELLFDLLSALFTGGTGDWSKHSPRLRRWLIAAGVVIVVLWVVSYWVRLQ